MATQSYTSSGTTPWVAPAGVWKVKVECWGGGGNGGYGGGADTEGGAGGGGGAYACGNTVSVTPGLSYNVVVGAVATDSSFGGTLVKADGATSASGQTKGNGGLVANCIGDVKYAGGNGGAGIVDSVSAAGGGAAGPDGAGGVGGGRAGNGGDGDAGSGGAGGNYSGGAGVAGASNVKGGGGAAGAGNNASGAAGGLPGGGGSGGEYGAGAGRVGQVILTYFEESHRFFNLF